MVFNLAMLLFQKKDLQNRVDQNFRVKAEKRAVQSNSQHDFILGSEDLVI